MDEAVESTPPNVPKEGTVPASKRKTRKKSHAWELVSIVPPEKASYELLSEKVRELRGGR